jgi:hypothetical protein
MRFKKEEASDAFVGFETVKAENLISMALAYVV